jgi:hypothetical protein
MGDEKLPSVDMPPVTDVWTARMREAAVRACRFDEEALKAAETPRPASAPIPLHRRRRP